MITMSDNLEGRRKKLTREEFGKRLVERFAPRDFPIPSGISILRGPQIIKYAKLLRGPAKTLFGMERFKHIEKVMVRFADGTKHIDEIKGLNKGHAMARAASNWEDAVEIRALGKGTP